MSRFGLAVVTILLSLGVFSPKASATVPGILPLAARIADADGTPISGLLDVRLRICDAALAGNVLWEEVHQATAVDGLFYVDVGSVAPVTNPLDRTVFDGGEVWLEMVVNSEVQAPRVPIGSVPYAIHSDDSDHLGGLGPSAYASALHTHPTPFASDTHVHAMTCSRYASASTALLPTQGTAAAQPCPDGSSVLGGGCEVTSNTSLVYLVESYPDRNSWACRWHNTTANQHAGRAYAFCCGSTTSGPQPP